MTEIPIRAAATILLIRKDNPQVGPQILMGQRGAKAAFMPSKFVFPGGAVDLGDDHAKPLPLSEACLASMGTMTPCPAAFVGAALRELREETGLQLRTSAQSLRFIFRAITPKGRPRRFDACFFMANAAEVEGDLDDFSAAQDELTHLSWLPLDQARALDLPMVTEIALAEAAAILKGHPQPGVPFFDNSGDHPVFRRL